MWLARDASLATRIRAQERSTVSSPHSTSPRTCDTNLRHLTKVPHSTAVALETVSGFISAGEKGVGVGGSLLFTGDVRWVIRFVVMPRRSRFASGGFVYHVLNPGAPWHAIVFFESQPTIPCAPGFEDVLEQAKDW